MTPVMLAYLFWAAFVVLFVTSPVSSINMLYWGRAMNDRKADHMEPSQLDKFKQAAKELETDNDAKRFKERVGKLVKHKPVEKSK